jgi:hypothetical protein
LLHDGPAYSDIKLSLSGLNNVSAISKGNYTVQDSAGIAFCDADIGDTGLIALATESE